MFFGKWVSTCGLVENTTCEILHFKDVLVIKSSPYPGMDPGARCHGVKTKPTGILCSKYEFFLINGYQNKA